MATIRFLGAAREVTGSCYLLCTRASRVLLECGARQGRDAEEANRQNENDLPAALDDIDAVSGTLQFPRATGAEAQG